MALGAHTGQVLRMILGEATLLAMVGITSGVVAALGLGRFIASMLYELKPYDPMTLIGASSLLILVALASSWVPAHRAATVDPMQALRQD